MGPARGDTPAKREVFIPGDAGRLEALFELPDGGADPVGGVVVAHPHPLHGGTMVQPVVHHVARACRRRGLATLRFNFRGAGRSGGAYSGVEEYRDVQAAAGHLRAELGGGLPVALAGYSFGSVMASLAVTEGEAAAGLALVAFPLRWEEFMPGFFTRLGEYGGPVLALCGERDDIAPPDEVEDFLRGVGIDPTTVVIPGADHFFGGAQESVGATVGAFLREVCLAAGAPAVRRAWGNPPSADC
ncbi:MAG: Dot/Icm type IV secretion system effector CoxH3 [Thermoleophilia bacterium]